MGAVAGMPFIPFSRPRAAGWKRDTRIEPGTLELRYGASRSSNMRAVDFVARAPTSIEVPNGVKDQGHAGSCTGQACSRIEDANNRARGIGSPYPSARKRYWDGRLYPLRDQTPVRLALPDDGAHPWDVVTSSTEWGECAEAVWPYTDAVDGEDTILMRPPLAVVQNASGYRVKQWKRISGGGDGRCDEIRKCIDLGHYPMGGFSIDSAFGRYRGGVYNRTRAMLPQTGLHMLPGLAYDEAGLWLINSWGLGDWGTWPGAALGDVHEREVQRLFEQAHHLERARDRDAWFHLLTHFEEEARLERAANIGQGGGWVCVDWETVGSTMTGDWYAVEVAQDLDARAA